MSIKDAEDQVNLTRRYVSHLADEIKLIGLYPRSSFQYIFDAVGLETLSKAFAIARSCLTLIDSGNPDEAYGLSRTLVECAANLRYLTADPEDQFTRSMQFVNFHHAEKRYALDGIRTFITDKELLDEAEKYAADEEVEAKENDPRAAMGHWSQLKGFMWKVAELSHPLDGASNDTTFRKKVYAADYHGTSAYVHCSVWGLNNYYFDPGAPFEINRSTNDYDQTIPKTLFIIGAQLYDCISYVLFGLKVDRPARINQLFSEFIETLEPPPISNKA